MYRVYGSGNRFYCEDHVPLETLARAKEFRVDDLVVVESPARDAYPNSYLGWYKRHKTPSVAKFNNCKQPTVRTFGTIVSLAVDYTQPKVNGKPNVLALVNISRENVIIVNVNDLKKVESNAVTGVPVVDDDGGAEKSGSEATTIKSKKGGEENEDIVISPPNNTTLCMGPGCYTRIPYSSHRGATGLPYCSKCWDSNNLLPEDVDKRNKEDNKMRLDLSSIFGEFGKDTSGNFKLSTMGLAIKDASGKFVCYNGKSMVDVMGMVFNVKDVIFKMPVASVGPKDLIITSGSTPLYVEEVNDDGSLNCFNPQTSQRVTYVPPDNIMGMKLFTKVISLFDLSQGINPGGNPMMPLLMGLISDEGESISDTSLVLAMTQMAANGGQAAGAQSMLPLMFLGDHKGNSSDLVKALLLGQFLNGQQGNLMGNMFGLQQPVQKGSCNCAGPKNNVPTESSSN
jgi:hypothetical protein